MCSARPRISSGKDEISEVWCHRKSKYFQKESPSLRQVFFKSTKILLDLHPASGLVHPLILQLNWGAPSRRILNGSDSPGLSAPPSKTASLNQCTAFGVTISKVRIRGTAPRRPNRSPITAPKTSTSHGASGPVIAPSETAEHHWAHKWLLALQDLQEVDSTVTRGGAKVAEPLIPNHGAVAVLAWVSRPVSSVWT